MPLSVALVELLAERIEVVVKRAGAAIVHGLGVALRSRDAVAHFVPSSEDVGRIRAKQSTSRRQDAARPRRTLSQASGLWAYARIQPDCRTLSRPRYPSRPKTQDEWGQMFDEWSLVSEWNGPLEVLAGSA